MQVLITTSPAAWVACPPRSPNTVKPSSRTSTIASGMLHHALRHHLPSTDGHDDMSAQPPPLKRRVLAAAAEGGRVNDPFGIRVDQDPFLLERLAHDLPWAGHAGAVDDAIGETEPQDDAHRRLETVEAVGARLLRGLVMRRMIGRDHVDHSFYQRLAQRIAVLGGPERRIDVAVWTHRRRVPRCERKVMRGGFSRHRQAIRLGGTNQLDRLARADVLDVEAGALDIAQ